MTIENYRKKYAEVFGDIPEGYEIHHKLPKRLGGTDEVDNLIAVTRTEHALLHLKLYKKYNDIRDLCSYYMLSGTFNRKSQSSIGGKIGGIKTYKLKLGIHNYTPELKQQWCSAAGKVGGKKQVELNLGIHIKDELLQKTWRSKGGKKGPMSQEYYKKQGLSEKEAEEEYRKAQKARGQKGGPKNKGFIWINDGEKSYKYTAWQQKEKSIKEFLRENPQYRCGRILKRRRA